MDYPENSRLMSADAMNYVPTLWLRIPLSCLAMQADVTTIYRTPIKL